MQGIVVGTPPRTPVKLNVAGLSVVWTLTIRVLGMAIAQWASWFASQPSRASAAIA
jgi:hypothetical protein